MNYRIITVAALLVALPAVAQKKKTVVNDSNTPLHLLQPAYQGTYGDLSPEQVKKDIDRVFNYIDKETPARVVDKNTGKVITDYTTMGDEAQLERGAFRLASYEWGVTYSALIAAAETTGDQRYADYVQNRFRFLAEVAPHFKPVCVVEHHSFFLAKLDETLHLTFEALCVVVDLLAGQHFSHIGSSGRVTDHGGAAADQGDRFVSCHLHPFHQGQCHEVTCGQTVCGAVESDIERCFSIVYQVSDFIFVGYLCQKASGDQFVINLHFVFLLFSVDFRVCVTVWDQSFLYKKTPVLSDSKDESPYLPCYHLTSQLSHGSCLCRYPKPLNTLTL